MPLEWFGFKSHGTNLLDVMVLFADQLYRMQNRCGEVVVAEDGVCVRARMQIRDGSTVCMDMCIHVCFLWRSCDVFG